MVLRSNKKGALELQMNFIILIILSLIILVFSTILLKNVLSSTSKMSSQVNKNLQQKIEKIMIENKKDVAIPFNFAHISKPGVVSFPIGIKNNLNNCNKFFIHVYANDPVGYTLQKRQITSKYKLIIAPILHNESVSVLKNDMKVKPIIVTLKKGPKGVYIINVNVTCNNRLYGDKLKAYIVYS